MFQILNAFLKMFFSYNPQIPFFTCAKMPTIQQSKFLSALISH